MLGFLNEGFCELGAQVICLLLGSLICILKKKKKFKKEEEMTGEVVRKAPRNTGTTTKRGSLPHSAPVSCRLNYNGERSLIGSVVEL